jgi:hypothetical protein
MNFMISIKLFAYFIIRYSTTNSIITSTLLLIMNQYIFFLTICQFIRFIKLINLNLLKIIMLFVSMDCYSNIINAIHLNL